MTAAIRPLAESDIDAVVGLSLRAWAPVFDSFRTAMGEAVYRHLYPDWSAMQAAAVASGSCRDEATRSWVADDAGGWSASCPSSTTTRPTASPTAARSR